MLLSPLASLRKQTRREILPSASKIASQDRLPPVIVRVIAVARRQQTLRQSSGACNVSRDQMEFSANVPAAQAVEDAKSQHKLRTQESQHTISQWRRRTQVSLLIIDLIAVRYRGAVAAVGVGREGAC